MASKTSTEDKRRRTTSVPVTTMEEIPVLSDQERADLAASLKEAEARVKSGQAIDYEPKTFKQRLLDIYRERLLPRAPVRSSCATAVRDRR